MSYLSRFLTVVLFLLSIQTVAYAASSSGAPVPVKGYYRKDGTYVAPYVRSAPNGTAADNYSTKGNVNPYTGEAGTKNVTDASLSSGSSQNIAPLAQVEAPKHEPTFVPDEPATAKPTNNAAANNAPSGETATLELILAEIRKLTAQVQKLESRIERLEAKGVAPSSANLANIPTPPTAVPQGLTGWRKIVPGMPLEQVRQLLGEPMQVQWPFWNYRGNGSVQFSGSSNPIVYGWTEPIIR